MPATGDVLQKLSRGVTPEMAAAVSKLMRNQDLIQVAKKCEVITRFRNTIGLRGRMSVRLQPNHPFDDTKGITASILDGILLGSGDACIGINPASDDPAAIGGLLRLIDDVIARLQIPTQGCVLAHVTTTLGLIEQGFRSIWCSSRSRGRRPPTAVSASTWRCCGRRIRPGCRCGAARSATT